MHLIFFGYFPSSAISSLTHYRYCAGLSHHYRRWTWWQWWIRVSPAIIFHIFILLAVCAVGLQIAYLSVYSHILHWELVVLLLPTRSFDVRRSRHHHRRKFSTIWIELIIEIELFWQEEKTKISYHFSLRRIC